MSIFQSVIEEHGDKQSKSALSETLGKHQSLEALQLADKERKKAFEKFMTGGLATRRRIGEDFRLEALRLGYACQVYMSDWDDAYSRSTLVLCPIVGSLSAAEEFSKQLLSIECAGARQLFIQECSTSSFVWFNIVIDIDMEMVRLTTCTKPNCRVNSEGMPAEFAYDGIMVSKDNLDGEQFNVGFKSHISKYLITCLEIARKEGWNLTSLYSGVKTETVEKRAGWLSRILRG